MTGRVRDRRTGRMHQDRGAVLVLAILMLFSVFAIAAVVVDLGLASLEQQRMQDAADAAALEGLRSGRAQGAEFAGASMAAFDAGASDSEVAVVGGDGSWSANVSLELTGRWLPELQQNVGDAANGDFVGGTYLSAAPHGERFDYARDDFAPGAGDRALLARLRRTTNPAGFDAEDQIASHGPTLPFLFGRGALIGSGDASYDPRRDGITVRATAIADGRPANAVHAPFGLAAELPIAPFCVDFALWTATDVNLPVVGLNAGTTALQTPGGSVLRAGDAVSASPLVTTLPLGVLHVMPLFTAGRLVAFGIAEATASGLIKRAGRSVVNATALDPTAQATFAFASRDDLALAPVLVR